MEVELKLLLIPTDVATFRRLALLPQFAVDTPHSQKLSITYFDTPELRLNEHSIDCACVARSASGSRHLRSILFR